MNNLKDKFDEFCKYKCPYKDGVESQIEYLEGECREIGCNGYAEIEFEYEINPCDYCSAKHFMQFLIDENNK